MRKSPNSRQNGILSLLPSAPPVIICVQGKERLLYCQVCKQQGLISNHTSLQLKEQLIRVKHGDSNQQRTLAPHACGEMRHGHFTASLYFSSVSFRKSNIPQTFLGACISTAIIFMTSPTHCLCETGSSYTVQLALGLRLCCFSL